MSETIDLHCIVVCGSTRAKSKTRMLAYGAIERLRTAGFRVSMVDTRELVLPIADPEFHHHPDEHPDPEIRRLTALFDSAHAVVLASPVYHGSYSGVLKNLLDHIRWNAFARRPVGLVVHGGNALSGGAVCEHLRAVVRTMAGYSVQVQVVSGPMDVTIDEAENVSFSESVELRFERMVAELKELATLMTAADGGIKGGRPVAVEHIHDGAVVHGGAGS